MRLQPIYDIAQICALKGVSEAILCPGSRCAPLITAFVRHEKINTRTISDERSAAFIAHGIAQAKRETVVLVCTSGSAAFNFAPAVAESYFQNTSLLILTADRPAEWVDQLDGQTIRQRNIYGSHVKKFYELPQDYDHADSLWHINRTLNEAINLSNQFPKGPVHINIPLREPLYEKEGGQIQFTATTRITDVKIARNELTSEAAVQLGESFNTFNKILIVAGQQEFDSGLLNELESFSKLNHIPVVGDVISNLHTLTQSVSHADSMLGPATEGIKKALHPELIITFGKSVISKSLKLYLRRHKPNAHWHIQEFGEAADTFQSLTSIIPVSPVIFFKQLGSITRKSGFEAQKRENYYRMWEAEEHRTFRSTSSFFSETKLNEFSLVNEILKTLPQKCNVHLANSMPVRYANFIGLSSDAKGIEVFANRGTSGIDGCTSTAVGHALVDDIPNILITGDMAFFYDRNAFWHNYKLPNLRIVMLNNHGGAIFSIIDGPAQLVEADEYFITNQKLSAKAVAQEFDFDYLKLDSLKKLKNQLKDFFDFDGRTKILEIETSAADAKKTVTEFKEHIKKNYADKL